MVSEYRLARYAEEMQNEILLDSRAVGEREFWKANGGKLIDFKDWLIGHRGRGRH